MSEVPSPFSKNKSYAQHFEEIFESELKGVNIKPEFISQNLMNKKPGNGSGKGKKGESVSLPDIIKKQEKLLKEQDLRIESWCIPMAKMHLNTLIILEPMTN